MIIEIERKFLLKPDAVPTLTNGVLFVQGYLDKSAEKTIRVRIAEKEAFITIKGKTESFSRKEFEYEIPITDAEELLLLCPDFIIRKTRYNISVGKHVWGIDVFHAENEGLILAEIELESEDETFERPDWIGKEVTDDFRYFNSYLSKNPFKNWE